MGLIFLLLSFASAEWVIELTLVDRNYTDYTSLTQLTTPVISTQRELDMDSTLCAADSLQDINECLEHRPFVTSSQIWLTHFSADENIENKLHVALHYNMTYMILVTNRTNISIPSSYKSSFHVFSTKDESLWDILYNGDGFEHVKLHSYLYCIRYSVDCKWVEPLDIVFGAVSLTWVFVIVWWFLNNHCFNRPDATVFHRLMTVLLILKAINVLSSFVLWTSCPFTRET